MSKTVELARHLEKLHINNMYKTDFYWTWDKTDEEIDALYKKGELATWTPADTARIKNFVEWHFFWDPERQAKRIGLEYPPKK